MTDDVLKRLSATIESRRAAKSDASYTRQLLDGGPEKCARKFGEEAIETVVAALKEENAALAGEAADTIYHLLVLLVSRGVAWADVEAILAGRMQTSGLQEKASRAGRPAAER